MKQEEFERFMDACLNGIITIFKLLEAAEITEKGLGDCMKKAIEDYIYNNKPVNVTIKEWIKSIE